MEKLETKKNKMDIDVRNSEILDEADRLQFIMRAKRRGLSASMIVEAVKAEIGISYSRQMYQADIDRLKKEWIHRRGLDMDILQMEEFEKRQEIINECWVQWEKSKSLQIEREIKKTKAAGQTEESVLELIKEKQGLGNIAYLHEIGLQYDKQAQIIGIAQKLEGGIINLNVISEDKIGEVQNLIKSLKPKTIKENNVEETVTEENIISQLIPKAKDKDGKVLTAKQAGIVDCDDEGNFIIKHHSMTEEKRLNRLCDAQTDRDLLKDIPEDDEQYGGIEYFSNIDPQKEFE